MTSRLRRISFAICQCAIAVAGDMSADISKTSKLLPVRPVACQPNGVPRDVFDGLGVLSAGGESRLISRSEIAEIAKGGEVPAKCVAEEAARHVRVAGLARQFSKLCEGLLGKKVNYHPPVPMVSCCMLLFPNTTLLYNLILTDNPICLRAPYT